MTTYKLYYFNGRGRVETARLIIAAAGKKCEDICYEGEVWATKKVEMPLGQCLFLK
jgi:glutathione S-transferase